MEHTPLSVIPNFENAPLDNIGDIDRLLSLADSTLINGRRSEAVIAAAIRHIVAHSDYGLRDIEMRLRALNSPSYLLAVAARHAPPATAPRTVQTGERTRYFLHVSVDGAESAKAAAKRFSVDLAGNLDHLAATGLLTVTSFP